MEPGVIITPKWSSQLFLLNHGVNYNSFKFTTLKNDLCSY